MIKRIIFISLFCFQCSKCISNSPYHESYYLCSEDITSVKYVQNNDDRVDRVVTVITSLTFAVVTILLRSNTVFTAWIYIGDTSHPTLIQHSPDCKKVDKWFHWWEEKGTLPDHILDIGHAAEEGISHATVLKYSIVFFSPSSQHYRRS